MTNPYASTYTARDSITAGIGGHGTRPLADPTGTTPKPSTSGIDPDELARFNAGVRRASADRRNECLDCGDEFAHRSGLARHSATHKTRATHSEPRRGTAGPDH
jgi:hypothetical protein